MEALYDRMASAVTCIPSSTDLAFSTKVLQTITCSLRVLTFPELSSAVGEDTSKMLNFQRSVMDLCGGFVVIDNDGNVAMIHQTAREYLLSDGNRPLHIRRDAAHRQMFLSCIRVLTSSGLRAKIQGNQTPEFLDYAASYWSSHLLSSPLHDQETLTRLNQFLTGTWVLTWIHFLARTKQLRILVRASQHLSKYVSRSREQPYSGDEQGSQFIKHELLRNWALDFLKILGKFGTSLRRDPACIYKSIPPFCPRKSSIYQLFGKTEAKHISISGLSAESWDDSVARISLSATIYASSIAAAAGQIAVLASSGIVSIFDSTTFEEWPSSPIRHGERLFRMELNSTGMLLSTYGYRTTKVWDISTGKCKLSVKNVASRPRPLAMLWINENTRLVVGTDDRCIRVLDVASVSPIYQLVAELEEPELEGHFLNAASYMAFSRDGTLVAVAYRGHPMSAWEIDGPIHIGHCWRQREEVTAGQVIEAVWHPHTPEVLGLYIEGTIFKWKPYDNQVEELAAGASRLAMSRDGNVFATGDVRGTVKVYTTSDFGLLYQLASEDNVLGLSFSPDTRRFYDIRGYYANAWEPDALIRYADQRGKDRDWMSDTWSLAPSSTTSTNLSWRIDAVTVLANSPKGSLYCYGTDKGKVRLHHVRQGQPADLYISKGFLSIEQMCWSPDGQSLSFSDSGKKVVIMAITGQLDQVEPVVQTKIEISMKAITTGPILQLLFHPDSTQLCAHSASKVHLISISSGAVTASLDLPVTVCKWIAHPQSSNLLLGVGANGICVLDWSLTRSQTYRFETVFHQPGFNVQEVNQGQLEVDRVLSTHDKRHVLVQVSTRIENSKEKTLLFFEASSLSVPSAPNQATDTNPDPLELSSVLLPQDLSSEISMCLGFLPQNRLVFLSKTFSICTARIPPINTGTRPPILPAGDWYSEERIVKGQSLALTAHDGDSIESLAHKSIKQLFSLPGDWINRDCVLLSKVWPAERSFMCPRNGEIAVVRCAELA